MSAHCLQLTGETVIGLSINNALNCVFVATFWQANQQRSFVTESLNFSAWFMSQDCAADLTIKLSDMHMVDYLMIYSITGSFPACIKLLDVKLCTHPLSVLLADICQSVITAQFHGSVLRPDLTQNSAKRVL